MSTTCHNWNINFLANTANAAYAANAANNNHNNNNPANNYIGLVRPQSHLSAHHNKHIHENLYPRREYHIRVHQCIYIPNPDYFRPIVDLANDKLRTLIQCESG